MLSLLLAQMPDDLTSTTIPTETTDWASPLSLVAALFASATFIIIILAVYVYMAIALMTIAKKTNTPNAWLAWIPIANLYLMTQIAQVPWWTMLVILIGWIPFVGSLAVLAVMLWWWWKISERCGYPGWLGILIIVPVANLIIPGILAWGKGSETKAV